jgi:hypothetical protein
MTTASLQGHPPAPVLLHLLSSITSRLEEICWKTTMHLKKKMHQN